MSISNTLFFSIYQQQSASLSAEIILCQQQQQFMLTQNRRKIPYVIVLILIICLTLLHWALAGTQDRWTDLLNINSRNKISQSIIAFIVVLATASFLIAILLLVDVFCNILKNKKLRHILIVILLIINFALACIAAFLATVGQRQRETYKDVGLATPQKLDQFYNVAVADAVLTFILILPLLGLAFYYSMDQIAYSPVADAPMGFPQIPGSERAF